MSLILREIELRDFRNAEHKHLDFGDSTTVLVGPNAAGKTNIIEAVQILTTGWSFRNPSPKELIREGSEHANIAARIEGDGRVVDVACDIKPQKRSFLRNGKRCYSKDIPGTLLCVLFNPDDLAFIKGSKSKRRGELDTFGRQANSRYASVLSDYSRAVEQRNRLLKEEFVDTALLDAWDEAAAQLGSVLLAGRARLFKRLKEKVGDVYAEISRGEKLSCSYVSSIGEGMDDLSKDELYPVLLRKLQEGRAEDIRRKQTCVGPHRDDIAFSISGRDARTYGSQGQQRSIVLAWKMSEVQVAADITDSYPLLLLDDVMSELDETRREAMTSYVRSEIQTLVTTTNLGYFSDRTLKEMEVIRVGDE